jgi:hypothetical protein
MKKSYLKYKKLDVKEFYNQRSEFSNLLHWKNNVLNYKDLVINFKKIKILTKSRSYSIFIDLMIKYFRIFIKLKPPILQTEKKYNFGKK